MSKYTPNEFKKRIELSHRMFYDIERNLKNFLDYVPLDFDHLNVYSLKLVTIILETGPEIINSFDLIAFPNPLTRPVNHQELRERLLEEERSLRERSPPRSLTFKRYCDFLNKIDINLRGAKVEIRGLAYTMPFEEEKPGWWNIYNELKHDKYSNLKKATLINALNSMSALYWLIHYHCDRFIDFPPVEKPEFSCYLFKYLYTIPQRYPLKKLTCETGKR